MNRLGIYGGTFDPPHIGHLVLAEAAADSLRLAQVLFVPAAEPPHKQPGSVRALAHHRLAMVERAIAGNPRFALSRADIDRPGPHYTADLLALLHAQHPNADLVFLIGSDSLRDLPRWSRPAEIIAAAWLGVMRRPGGSVDLAALDRAVPGVAGRVLWIEAPLLDVAASDLAARLAAGRSARYLIPDSVLAYIHDHGLYRK